MLKNLNNIYKLKIKKNIKLWLLIKSSVYFNKNVKN